MQIETVKPDGQNLTKVLNVGSSEEDSAQQELS